MARKVPLEGSYLQDFRPMAKIFFSGPVAQPEPKRVIASLRSEWHICAVSDSWVDFYLLNNDRVRHYAKWGKLTR